MNKLAIAVLWGLTFAAAHAAEPGRTPLPAIARFALGETEVRSALPSAGLFPAPPTPTDPDAA